MSGIAGVRIFELKDHRDDRGTFTEVFRNEWDCGIEPIQWNLVKSSANVLRGMHVHKWHTDYLMVASGTLVLALHDLRSDSPTRGLSELHTLDTEPTTAAVIPIGVVHGFFFPEPTSHIYAVSHYWNHDDELGCMWNSPEFGIQWPCEDPSLSARDQNAGTYEEMARAYHAE